MNKYEFTDKNGLTWERVDKRTARKAFYAGDIVRACACNIRPDGPMGAGWFKLSNDGNARETFEAYENMLYAYNCNDNETGRYPAYYVRKPFTIAVRAPRFSHGGAGYVTADTLELNVNGRPVKRTEYPHVFHDLADTINYKPGADLVRVVRGSLY